MKWLAILLLTPLVALAQLPPKQRPVCANPNMLRFVPQFIDVPQLIGPSDDSALVNEIVATDSAVPTEDGYYNRPYIDNVAGFITVGTNDTVVFSSYVVRSDLSVAHVVVVSNSAGGGTSFYSGTSGLTLKTNFSSYVFSALTDANLVAFGKVLIVAVGGKLFYDDGNMGGFTEVSFPAGTFINSVTIQNNKALAIDSANQILYWSADGDYTTWRSAADAVTSTNVSAGFLPVTQGPGGKLTGIQAFRDSVFITKFNSSFVATFIGPPLYYRIDMISASLGAVSNYNIVNVDGQTLYLVAQDSRLYQYTGQFQQADAAVNYVLTGLSASTIYARSIAYNNHDKNLYIFLTGASGLQNVVYVVYNIVSGLATTSQGLNTQIFRGNPSTFLSSTDGLQSIWFFSSNGKFVRIRSAEITGTGAINITYRAVGHPFSVRTLNQAAPLTIMESNLSGATPMLFGRYSNVPVSGNFTETASGVALNTSTYRYDMLSSNVTGRYIAVRQYEESPDTFRDKYGPILLKFSQISAN